MKISNRILKQFIDFNLKPEELAEQLSMLGLEIAGFEKQSSLFERIVVGEVLKTAKHPNADKLTLCRVNVGKETLEIVCGAPNVAAGQKVAVALVGAALSHNQHDPEGKPFVIQRTKIRGVESNGMICSRYELGLGDDRDGILVLEEKAKVGMELAKHLGMTDVIYEIEVTANRGDWLSHLGVAREVAALTGKRVKIPDMNGKESGPRTKSVASVKILDKEKCRRYSARVLRNIKVEPSPQWLQDALVSLGFRPINNVVDVTNYVMAELGQPLHAFDYEKLADGRIEVRCAMEGQSFTTLDGKVRRLSAEMLMICDAKGPVAIGGVMGGVNSEIGNNTTTILLESANFDPGNIRRTAKSLGLSTDASQRFERSADIEMTVVALNRAAQLLQEFSGAEVLPGILDVYPKKIKPKRIRIRTKRTNEILGTSLKTSTIASLLKKLGLSVEGKKSDSLLVGIPTFRTDLVEEIDLIEEVARMFGYDKIETKATGVVDFAVTASEEDLRDVVRTHFVGAGYNEILANTLQDKLTASLSGEPTVEVLNPVSVDMAMLRTSMIPGALHVVRRNQFQGNSDLRMFEIGRTYSLRKNGAVQKWDDFAEEERLLVFLSGKSLSAQYSVDSRNVDLFDLKGELQTFFAKFHLDKYRLISYDNDKALTVDNLLIEIQDTYAGFLGKVKREILQKFEIEGEVFVCELAFSLVEQARERERKFVPLPKYPSVTRDVAFVVDGNTKHAELESAIVEAGGPLLIEVRLFDVYIGEQLEEGKKSLAYALRFQALDRTLTDHEIHDVMARIVKNVQVRCGGTLRA